MDEAGLKLALMRAADAAGEMELQLRHAAEAADGEVEITPPAPEWPPPVSPPVPPPPRPPPSTPSPTGWSGMAAVDNWKEVVLFPDVPFSGPISSLHLEMAVGASEAASRGLQNFLYLRRDKDKWQNKTKTSGDAILLVDRSEQGRLVLSTTLSGEVVRSRAVPWPTGDFRLYVSITGTDAVVRVERPPTIRFALGEVIACTNLVLPSFTVKSRLLLSAGHPSTDGPPHATNEGMSLLWLEGGVS